MYPWADIEVPDEDTLNRLLSKTKGQLFIFNKASGFLGSLMCDHRYVWDETCGTAWCNGTTIGWNPQFFMWLTPSSRLTVLVHELWHTGYDHMSRLGQMRCPDVWNQAADFVINNQMKHWGFDFSQLMSINPCLDHQYDGMSTEEVYDLLPKPPGMPMPQPDPNGKPQDGLSGDVRAPASAEDAADIKGRLVKAVQASQMAKEAGVIPGETTLLLEQFLEPILPWEVLLERFYTDLSKDDYSWKRPSRRYEDEYLPSMEGDNRLEHLTYYMDVSGSVTDAQVLRFFSEVKFIHETYQPKRISMVTFDTMIQDELEMQEDEPFAKIEIHGRGGTSLDPVYHHIKSHRPTAAIIFSDLHCHPMRTDPGVPVLWVVIDNNRAQTHFGKRIHIKA